MSPVCPGVKEDEPETALGYFENDAPHARYRWKEIGEALGVSAQAAHRGEATRMHLGIQGRVMNLPGCRSCQGRVAVTA